MAGADETDGGDKKVVEVESLVRLILWLDNDAIKVLQDHSNIWKQKMIFWFLRMIHLTNIFDVVEV